MVVEEGGRVYGKLKSLNYKPSSIPSGGLDVPLLLKFESQDKRVTDTMEFVENLHSFDFAWDFVVNDEDEEEIDFETFETFRNISKHSTENSNENDESELNEKGEGTVTLDDPVTNETKKVPVVIID